MLDQNIIQQYLRNYQKVEAIKYVVENSTYNLKQAKNLIEALANGASFDVAVSTAESTSPWSGESNETVRVTKRNGKTNITYIDANGLKTEHITPNHPLWKKVKKIMHNNPIVQEMERNANPFDASSTNTSTFQPIIQESASSKKWIILIAILMILASLVYTFLR